MAGGGHHDLRGASQAVVTKRVIGDHYPLWRLVLTCIRKLQSQGMQLQMQLNERVFGCGDGPEGVAGMEQISNGVQG